MRRQDRPHRFFSTALSAALLTLLATPWCVAELLPEHVAVIAARGNQESLSLARYYCEQRGVPLEHICEVDLSPGEVLDREQWRWAVRPEIQKWITDNDPEKKLRCLVTTWGTPLKIGPAKRDRAIDAYLDHVTREHAARVGLLEAAVVALDAIASGQAAATTPTNKTPTAGAEPDATRAEEPPPMGLAERLESALQAAQARIASLPLDQRPTATVRMEKIAAGVGGARVLLHTTAQRLKLRRSPDGAAPEPLLKRFHALRGQTAAFQQVKLWLDQRAPSIERDTISLPLIEQAEGQLGAVQWLEKQIQTAKGNETGAAFDSELSLIMWQDNYQLLRWQPNYLSAGFDGSQLRETYRTMIVARLDGPTLAIAKGLVDTAIRVEKQGGLKGAAYFDARGLAKRATQYNPGSYPDFDRSLLLTADQVGALRDAEGEPRFEVRLDNEPGLFQPGQCPNAALYCGWYSLGKYVDAFDWQPGAEAYHMASGEAATLKEIDSRCWCKRLLEDGVCVTIGPVYEPYLIAFPRPDRFMALLLQGSLPVGEVYARTKPFNSWMMTLIGDPLYRPFSPR